jgi:6-phosphogluconolactonase
MTATSARTFVYIAASDSGELFVLEMEPATGALVPIQAVELRSSEPRMGACPMALSPDRRFLYAALRSEPYAVQTFSRDPASGRLTKIGEAPLPHSMAYVSTDGSGRFLLCASYPGSLISAHPIYGCGIAGRAAQVVPTPPSAHAILPDPQNRFVLNTSLGGDVLMSHRFDATTGALTPNSPSSVSVKSGAGPRHFRFHPNGRFCLPSLRARCLGLRFCLRGRERQAERASGPQRPSARLRRWRSGRGRPPPDAGRRLALRVRPRHEQPRLLSRR